MGHLPDLPRKLRVQEVISEEIVDRLWGDAPRLRRSLVGRAEFERIVAAAVLACPESADADPEGWSQRAERNVGFGPLFWIIAAPLLQYCVQRLIQWWIESRRDRSLISAWKREMS